MSTYRVVVQVAQSGREFYTTVLRNIRNVSASLDDVEIRVIAHGEGIDFVTGENGDDAAIRETLNTGVDIFACQIRSTAGTLPRATWSPESRPYRQESPK